jgi:hypothetical protein
LRIRTRYAALMMLGIGMMLFAVAGSVSKDQAVAVGGWSVAFLLLSVLLLGVISIAAVREQLVGVAVPDVKNALGDEGNKNTSRTSSTSEVSNISESANTAFHTNELSDLERNLIKLLRSNDIPPDIVADSIREVMERRMGR